MGLGQAAAELRGRLTVAAWLIFHLLAGAGGAWVARRYALQRGLVDQPGERRSHTVPTPRSGGIGIVVALLAGGAWLLATASADSEVLGAGLAGFAAVALVGLSDDHRPLSPWLRLVVHAASSAVLAAGAWLAWRDPASAIAAFVLAMVLTNVWNFMDGIDGIATTQAMLVAAAVAWMGPPGWTNWLALGLVAACAGFLPLNFPKARLFLGDVGSGAIGFLLALLLVSASRKDGGPDAWALWAFLPAAFLVDAALTLAGRMRRGEAWWRPHALHAYQRWARRAGSHGRVTLAYAAWTLLGWTIAAGMRDADSRSMFIACAAWYTASAAIWWMLQGKGARAVTEDRE